MMVLDDHCDCGADMEAVLIPTEPDAADELDRASAGLRCRQCGSQWFVAHNFTPMFVMLGVGG